MKDQRKDKEEWDKRDTKCKAGDAPAAVPCGVCLAQGAPCPAMTQQLFSGKAESFECQLMQHSF